MQKAQLGDEARPAEADLSWHALAQWVRASKSEYVRPSLPPHLFPGGPTFSLNPASKGASRTLLHWHSEGSLLDGSDHTLRALVSPMGVTDPKDPALFRLAPGIPPTLVPPQNWEARETAKGMGLDGGLDGLFQEEAWWEQPRGSGKREVRVGSRERVVPSRGWGLEAGSRLGLRGDPM